MSSLFSILRPYVFKLDPEVAHEMVRHSARWVTPSIAKKVRQKVLGASPDSFSLPGIVPSFDNSVGLAAGFDKNAEMLWLMYALGYGFVEVGTVTPLPQEGNPKPRIFRLPEQKSLINRLGFNNVGMAEFYKNFTKYPKPPFPVGINIGKNKNTPNEQALSDYQKCAQLLAPLADYLVINLSSPNTPGLRGLLELEFLKKLETEIVLKYQPLPVFLKIPPLADMPQLPELVEFVLKSKFAGVIASNTTVQREQIGIGANAESGGISGQVLHPLALQTVQMLCDARKKLELPNKIIVGVGGIMDSQSLASMRATGCDLQQVYTGMIYGGPQFVATLVKKVRPHKN